jgi:ribosomal protein S18 acetylase RimI-like enzyme
MGHVTLSPARPEHYAFALALYLETMEPYTAELMVWDAARQTAGFAQQWRAEDVRIIALEGCEIGWLQAQESDAEIWLQQLYVVPQRQNQGIGSHVLELLMGEWRPSRKPIVLTVLKNNPARRLYERFGFSVVEEGDVKIHMRLEP